MARQPETVFYTSVHKHLPPKPVLHREKMNNPYSSGTPDFWFSGKQDLWVEYKWLPRDPQRGVVVPTKLLNALQAEWLRNRHAEGRTVAVIIGCPSGGVALPGVSWDKELPAKVFMSLVLSRRDLADWILRQVM